MQFSIVSVLLSVLALNVNAQSDCSANFQIVYEANTVSPSPNCIKSSVFVHNIDRSCIYALGGQTFCMLSGFGTALLPGTKENALKAAEQCQCKE